MLGWMNIHDPKHKDSLQPQRNTDAFISMQENNYLSESRLCGLCVCVPVENFKMVNVHIKLRR